MDEITSRDDRVCAHTGEEMMRQHALCDLEKKCLLGKKNRSRRHATWRRAGIYQTHAALDV